MFGDDWPKRVLDELRFIRHELRGVKQALNVISSPPAGDGSTSTEELQFMADIRSQLSDLATKVEGQTTVIQGAKDMLDALRQAVKDAQGQLNAGDEASASETLASLSAAIETNTDKLSKALAANTEADDEVHSSGT